MKTLLTNKSVPLLPILTVKFGSNSTYEICMLVICSTFVRFVKTSAKNVVIFFLWAYMKLHLRLYSKSVGHSENKERLANACQRRHRIQLQSCPYLLKSNRAQISTHVVAREYFHHPCYIRYFRFRQDRNWNCKTPEFQTKSSKPCL